MAPNPAMKKVTGQPTTGLDTPPSPKIDCSSRDLEAAQALLQLAGGTRLPYRPKFPQGPIQRAPSPPREHLQQIANKALSMCGLEPHGVAEELVRKLEHGTPVPGPHGEAAAAAGSSAQGEQEASPRNAPQQEQMKHQPAGQGEGRTRGAASNTPLTAGSRRHPLPNARPKTKPKSQPQPKPEMQSPPKPKAQPKSQAKPQPSRKRKRVEKEEDDDEEDKKVVLKAKEEEEEEEDDKKVVSKAKKDEEEDAKTEGSAKKKAKKARGAPVVCDECEERKVFPRMDHLVRHKKTVHGYKTGDGTQVLLRDECDVCHELFTRTDNLHQHRKKRHEETGQVPIPEKPKDRPKPREVLIRQDDGTRYVPKPVTASSAAAAAAPGGTQSEVQPEAQPEGSPAPEETGSGSGTVSSETVGPEASDER